MRDWPLLDKWVFVLCVIGTLYIIVQFVRFVVT